MVDYLNIGSVPCDEDCAQVGSDNYTEQSKKECLAFAKQLIRVHGNPPEGAKVVIKTFPHDFGSYREVCVVYDDNNDKACDYAFTLESEMPEQWDEQAREELGI